MFPEAPSVCLEIKQCNNPERAFCLTRNTCRGDNSERALCLSGNTCSGQDPERILFFA